MKTRRILTRRTILLMTLFLLSPVSLLAQRNPTTTTPETVTTADLVKLYVSVSDKNGDLLPKLNYYDFEVTCDKVSQQVTYFAKKDEPVGIVFLLDMSGSMREVRSRPSSPQSSGSERGWKDTYQKLIASLLAFIENSHPLNEYSVILFNEQPWLASGWTRDHREVENSLSTVAVTKPVGRTSLYDSLAVAIEQAKISSCAKRAIILLTDGEDRTSKLERTKLNTVLQENNIPVYALSLNPDLFSLKNRIYTFEKSNAEKFFLDLALITGGTSFFPLDQKDMALCLGKIAKELRNQYVVGFKPNCTPKGNKAHQVKVRLSEKSAVAAMSKTISIRHREAYKTSLPQSSSK